MTPTKKAKTAGIAISKALEPLSPAERRQALEIAFTLAGTQIALRAPGPKTETALAFIGKRDGTSAKDLALEVGIAEPAAQQLLYTLKIAGLVTNPKRGAWVLT